MPQESLPTPNTRKVITVPATRWWQRTRSQLHEWWPTLVILSGVASVTWVLRGYYDENSVNVERTKTANEIAALKRDHEALSRRIHSVAKPVIQPLQISRIEVSPQSLNEKYVVTHFEGDEQIVESLGYKDRSRYTFHVSNSTDRARTIKRISFTCDHRYVLPFSGKTTYGLKSVAKTKDFDLFDIDVVCTSEKIISEREITISAGQTKEICIQFFSMDQELHTILKIGGCFSIESADGARACSPQISLVLHPDGREVQYGVSPDDIDIGEDQDDFQVIDIEERLYQESEENKDANSNQKSDSEESEAGE